MRSLLSNTVAALVVLLPATVLTADLQDQLQACSLLSDGAERLACFDTLADEHARGASDSDNDRPLIREASEETGFGLRQRPAEDSGPERITSRHVGEFRGWSGETVFHLENGQVWRQAQTGRMHWVADSPLITIRGTPIGTYWLTVEGVNAQIRVRRLQ